MKKKIVTLLKAVACGMLMLTGVIALGCAPSLADKGYLTEAGEAITMVAGIAAILVAAKIS